MRKKIMNTPGWLALNADRSAFIYLPDRAEVVREIFDLSIKGLGGYSIAKLLNSRNVPAFGTSGRWDQSTIHNMLTSRATIGEFQKKQIIEGKEYPFGEPISGYYPPVIDEETFEAAQVARRSNLSSGRGRKGRFITQHLRRDYNVRLLQFRRQISQEWTFKELNLQECFRER